MEQRPPPALRRLALLAHHADIRPRPRTVSPGVTGAAATFVVLTEAQRRAYDEQGFVKISGLVPEDMVQRLLTATDSLTELARSLDANDTASPLSNTIRTALGAAGEGPPDLKRHNPDGYLHTLGQPWSVSGVLHPDLPESKTFLEYYGSPNIVAAAQAFLGGQELQLGDISPFVNPQEADFCIGWHRDMNWYSDATSDHPDFSEEAERAVRLHHLILCARCDCIILHHYILLRTSIAMAY